MTQMQTIEPLGFSTESPPTSHFSHTLDSNLLQFKDTENNQNAEPLKLPLPADGSNCSTEVGTSDDEESADPENYQPPTYKSPSIITKVSTASKIMIPKTTPLRTSNKVTAQAKTPANIRNCKRCPSSLTETSPFSSGQQHLTSPQITKVQPTTRFPTTNASARKFKGMRSDVCKTSGYKTSIFKWPNTSKSKRSNSLKEPIDSQLLGQPSSDSQNRRNVKRFTRSETLILFDWDDTLLPSSWLAERQLTLDHSSLPSGLEQTYLDGIASTVCSLLVAAVHCGRVVVVTNAESGWVDLSAAKFMPTVLETLNLWHISVISARSEFESAQLQHPVQWKVEAFRHLLLLAYPPHTTTEQPELTADFKTAPHQYSNHYQRDSSKGLDNCRLLGRRNVVSFGDSDSERIALIQCVKSVAGDDCSHSTLYKSFKLCEHPTPTILQRQLQLIQRLLPQIIQHSGNLDLRINFKVASTTRLKPATNIKRFEG